MIVKHIPIRKLNKSSYSGLVRYITNSLDRNERVGEIRITNCLSEHPTWAAIEAENIQMKNKRSLVDKTYHLLVSFREGEHPSLETMHGIEEKLCAALGYQDHQRVSAVHYDTDHQHLHIAINKVHPLKLTTRQPYNDYKIFAELCPKLEHSYKLDIDNHVPRRTLGEAKAHDMEMAAGIESLIGWVKRECMPELRAAESWEELHRALAHNSLKIEQRGNGLVIKDKQGIAIKASSLERSFSMTALEKRLGAFEPCVAQEIKITKSYEIKPMVSKIDTRQLWSLYQHEKVQHKQRHLVLRQRARQRRDRRIEMAKKLANSKRVAITLTKGRLAKTMLHHSVSDSFMKEMRTIQQDYQADQRLVYQKGKHIVWYDWLKAKAWEGNNEALDVLRHRYERKQVRVNSITSEGLERVNYLSGAKIELVTKRGTIHYQIAQTVLRDDGRVLRLADNISQDVVEAALRLSIQKFGRQLSITGTDNFRRQAIEAATTAKLNIVFADPEMEQQRKRVLTQRINTTNPDAVDLYITERTLTRSKGIDILPHRRYVESDAGKHIFAGLREIEGQTLMLLQTPKEMLVLSIDNNTIRRSQHLRIGNAIDVTDRGIVRSRGRRI